MEDRLGDLENREEVAWEQCWVLERAQWGRVGKVTEEGGERWGSPRL